MTPSQTKLLEDLRSGAVRLVPVVPTREMQHAYFDEIDRNMTRVENDCSFGRFDNQRAAYGKMLAASPDLPASLAEMIEGLVKRTEKAEAREEKCERIITEVCDERGKQTARALASESRVSALEAEVERLRGLVCEIAPYIDSIVCYASTVDEHLPNRIAHEVRAVCYGPSQDELVGRRIAEQMITKIDAVIAQSSVERAWLIELKGTTPSWAIVNPRDYDEHWTTDSTRALRFARKIDAETYIAHIGWTEAFASEHIWDDGLPSSGPAPETWRDLNDARLQRAIDAFYEPCEGTTIDGLRNAILAWERG